LPVALRLQYQQRPPHVPAPILVRFAEFVSGSRHESIKDAWGKFSARAGRGFRAHKPLRISLWQVYHYFPVTAFYQIQKQLRTIHEAQISLGGLRLNLISEIRSRLPDRPKRQRAAGDFQI
jgi:hypothetical protein